MKHVPHTLLLVGLAVLFNGVFLWYYDASQFFAISQLHGQVGYNLVRHNSCNINAALTEYCGQLQQQKGRLIDYDEIIDQDFGFPQEVFPINDTIGYGMLLGLVWKLTGSLRFIDIQILQIIIYALLMILCYQISLLLFGNSTVALYCSLAHLFFFPLLWLNVQPVRDIWAYYGVVILVYGVLRCMVYVQERRSWFILTACGILFSICQFIRPSVFCALIVLSLVSFLYAYWTQQKKIVLGMMVLVWFLNGVFFWLPFFAYNLQAYNRWFVGPVGQDLLEGLGEFNNPWGYQLCDRWVAHYIGKKYNVVYGTPAFDDVAKKEFYRVLYEHPLLYVSAIIKRIPYLIFPGLPWIYSYNQKNSLKIALSKWYIRLFLLLGYLGFLHAFVQKRYFFLVLVGGILLASLGKLPSHIEYRYLIPFYWIFSLGVGRIFELFIHYCN